MQHVASLTETTCPGGILVLPVSDELTCTKCHSSTSGDAAEPAAGWVNDPNPTHDFRLNILRLHDEQNAADPLYAPALATAGYDAAGLHATATGGTMAMQCQSCHGNMTKVADPARDGWLDEPSCQQCHTGTATHNAGKIRFTSVFDAQGNPHVPADLTFATDQNVPAAGKSLYRFSTGHGGLACSACHGSTHAEFPSSHANDNLQSIALQGHDGVLADCATCHGGSPSTISGGPHGMHPIGAGWVDQHADAAEEGGQSQCRACHGANYRGTVLSRALGDRTFSTEFGTKKFWNGFQIGCYACHDGPGGEGGTKNHAAKVKSKTVYTNNVTPRTIKLNASDSDGNALTRRVVRQPAHGTVGINGKKATYFPDGGFVGKDTFTFAAWDGKIDSNLGTVTVIVEDGTCPATLAPTSDSFDVAPGMGAVQLTIPADCDWTAALSPPSTTWITITSMASGTGPGLVTYSVLGNAGAAERSASLVIANESFVVTQAGQAGPNLTASWNKLTQTCTNRCKLAGVLRVENSGQHKAAKSKVAFYLSDDAALDSGDAFLSAVKVTPLKAGRVDKIKLKKKLGPGESASGKVVLAVLDAAGKVTEADEADGVVVFGPLP